MYKVPLSVPGSENEENSGFFEGLPETATSRERDSLTRTRDPSLLYFATGSAYIRFYPDQSPAAFGAHLKKLSLALIYAALAASLIAPSIAAQPHWTLKPSFQIGLGHTKYVLDITSRDSLGREIRTKSELVYPLDVFMPGLILDVTWNPYHPRPWDSRIGVWTNVTDPAGTMTDRDWSNYWRDIYLPDFREVSSTESDAEMHSVMLDVEIGKVIVAEPKLALRGFFGYRYHWIDQELFGITGWQLVRPVGSTSLQRIEFDIPDIRALTYTVRYHLPHAGLEILLPIGDSIRLSGRAAYTAVIVSDQDEHVLRNFRTNADLTGHGLMSGAEIRFFLPGIDPRRLFVSVSGEFVYLSASGTKTQYWYDDEMGIDPNTGEEVVRVPAGYRITRIPHDISSVRGQIGAEIGIGF
jgi:outer membrane protease